VGNFAAGPAWELNRAKELVYRPCGCSGAISDGQFDDPAAPPLALSIRQTGRAHCRSGCTTSGNSRNAAIYEPSINRTVFAPIERHR